MSQMVYDRATSNSFDKLDCFFLFFKWVKNNKMFLPKDIINSSYVSEGGDFSFLFFFFPDINPSPTFFD